MKSVSLTKLVPAAIAILSILVGVIVSPGSLIGFLRSDTGDLTDELLLGASLFKAGLVLLGLLIFILSRLPIWDRQVQGANNPSERQSKSITGILALLLLVSFLIRLYRLGEGLWFDEILTYMNYARLPMGQVVSTYASENQHVLFSIFARICFVLFGESAWALRLPAVLFGVGSLWALFQLGRKVSSEREALLATALMAFSYHHVWFSQNARGYTGLLFWAILASWLLLVALQEGHARQWIWYGAAAALGMYTHLTMMFVIFSHVVIYLLWLLKHRQAKTEHRWFGVFLGFGTAGFLTFLLYALVIPQLLVTIEETQSVVNEWKNPLWTLLELFNGIIVNFSGGLIAIGSVLAIGALVIFGAGTISYWRTNRNVVFLLFVPSVVGAGLTVAMGHHLWPRFFFFAFGFGVLVVIRGIMLTGRWLSGLFKISSDRADRLGLALSIGAILALAISAAFAYGPKQDYDAALAYVESQKRPDDAIVTTDLAAHIYEEFYQRDWQVVESLDELDEARSASGRTWILYTFPPVLASVYPDIMERIESDFQIVKSFEGSVREGTIFVGLADSPAP